jgi:hypothetical protein
MGEKTGLVMDVPEELAYDERVFWIFTFKESVILFVFALPALWIFFKLDASFSMRVIVGGGLFFLGLALAKFRAFQENVWNGINYFFGFKTASWTDSALLQRFVSVKDIEGNFVYLQDGRVLCVLGVRPLDYSVLSDAQKSVLVFGFMEFVNSLSFPIQIVMRTARVNLTEYFARAKLAISKKRDLLALEEMEKFEEFVESYLVKHSVHDRLFYLVIPMTAKADLDVTGRELSNRVEILRDKLNSIGLASTILSKNKLVNLYASFFEGFVESDADYLSVVTMLDYANDYYEKVLVEGHKFVDRREEWQKTTPPAVVVKSKKRRRAKK